MNNIPSVVISEYACTLPLSGLEIKYRPFLVKEEKIMMMAIESNNESETIGAILQIVTNCTFNKIVVKDLPSVDLEYLFVEMRKKAKGEIARVGHKCSECKKIQELAISLNSVKVINGDLNTLIQFDEQTSVKMHFPTTALTHKISEMQTNSKDPDTIIRSIGIFIESLIKDDDVYLFADFTEDEIAEWIGNLDHIKFNKLEVFFTNMPALEIKHSYTCENEKCKSEETVILRGISSFFG